MQHLNHFFDKAMKRAERVIEDQQFISDLLDKAFVRLGQASEQRYQVQDQVLGLMRMISSWLKREYTEVSTGSIIALVAALIYFVNPFDLISDLIPFVGFLDDIAVITYVVRLFNKEIERFMAWEARQAPGNGGTAANNAQGL